MCGVVYMRLIGPYFYSGTLTAQRFLTEILEGVVADFIDDVPLQSYRRIWFQADGAPAHYGIQVRARLDVVFPQRWLGRGGPVPWPARSPDLTPLDFFLWGYVKDMVYVTPVPSLEDLKDRITTACASITAEMLADVRQTLMKRIRLCYAADGQHFEQLI